MVPESAAGKGNERSRITGAKQIETAPCYLCAMRKERRICTLVWLTRQACLLLSLVAGATAQQNAATSEAPSTPKAADVTDLLHTNPAAFLAEASRHIGLQGADLPQLRLKVSFKVLDEDGKVKDSGIFEEYRGLLPKIRIGYSSNAFTSTTYEGVSEQLGEYRAGAQTPPPWPLSELPAAFGNPLPDNFFLSRYGLDVTETKAGDVALSCVKLLTRFSSIDGVPADPSRIVTVGVFCFEHGKNELRAYMPLSLRPAGIVVTRLNTTEFQGKSIPTDLLLIKAGKAALTAHLESIEALTSIDDTLLTPPADAKFYPTIIPPPPPPPAEASAGTPNQIKVISERLGPPTSGLAGMTGSGASGAAPPERVTISGGIAVGMLLHQVAPDYPPIAKAMKLQGTVVLQATLMKDGTIDNLQVISGSPILQQAAIDAVKQWVYKPYTLNGEPVEVQTTVNVIFTLGGPAKEENPNP
jgi:protein TonB